MSPTLQAGTTIELGSRSFEMSDQRHFAELSGDHNPIHLDALFARRSELGAPIVHGVHVVLWALEELCRQATFSMASIRAEFAAPVYAGDAVLAELTRLSEATWKIQLFAAGGLATTVCIGSEQSSSSTARLSTNRSRMEQWTETPLAPDLQQMRLQAGAIALPGRSAQLAAAFPSVCAGISPVRVAGLLALSRLVGMTCPGLHSLFKDLSLDFTQHRGDDGLRFETRDVNERFRLVRMAVAAPGIEGEIGAFARHPPVAQPPIGEFARIVPRGAYCGANVLVVGGSRGVGEVVAKASAAGGARVLITYAVGRCDALNVAREIRDGGGFCDVMRLDVRDDIEPQLANMPFMPTHVYYCASPPVTRTRPNQVDGKIVRDLARLYTTGFLETCRVLRAISGIPVLRVFYPSTTALGDPAKCRTDFAAAKAAGEALCLDMNRNLEGVRILCRRLPQMRTDRTATVIPDRTVRVADVMLPCVREMHGEEFD